MGNVYERLKMENKFNFGDTVRHKSDNNKKYGIILDTNGSRPAVKWLDIVGPDLENESDLELIPHPDTARLNWLEKKMLEDSDQTIVCDGYNGFCTLGNFREHRPPIFENIREAIDHEMKKQGD